MTLIETIKNLKCNSILIYDGKEYPDDLADVVVSDGFIESTRFPTKTICDMCRISMKYVVINWKHLLSMTRVRKTETGYDNVYCSKEMRILSGENGLKIIKKIPLEGNGQEIWIMKKI